MDPVIFGSIPKSRVRRLQGYIKGLSGLIAYYPLDESSGNAINRAPSTIGSYDGTVSGATQGQSGQVGKAYSFDGTNDKITLGSPGPTIRGLAQYSVFALATITNTATARGIWYESNGVNVAQSRFFMFINADETVTIQARAGDAESLQSSATTGALTIGANLIIATVNIATDTVKIYFNGVEKTFGGSFSFTATSVADTAALQTPLIGVRDGDQADYAGLMQHVGLVNRVLTPAEVSRMTSLTGLA